MMCAGLLGLAIGRGLKLPTPGAPQPGAADIRVLKGLAALSEDIGIAAGGLENYPTNRGTYYLWSVERVAMLFDLPTIGDKDWYRWGAGILLAGQQRDGSWTDILVNGKDQGALTAHRLGPGIDTSFALLFLKRSHPMKDLTPKLPSSGKGLNQAITRLLSGDALPGSTADTPSRSAKPER